MDPSPSSSSPAENPPAPEQPSAPRKLTALEARSRFGIRFLVLLALLLWFGYDGWFNPKYQTKEQTGTRYFNKVGSYLLLAGLVYYGVMFTSAAMTVRRQRELGIVDAPSAEPVSGALLGDDAVSRLTQPLLAQGESLVAWALAAESQIGVLTTKNFKLLRLSSVRLTEAPRVTREASIALARVSGFTVNDSTVNGQRQYLLEIRGDGQQIAFSIAGEAGAALAQQIRNVVGLSHGQAGVTSVSDELEKLSGLAERGVLSPEEWERAKALFLGKPSDKREAALHRLDKLYDLRKSGALSESEFNMTKWDILSKP